MDTLTMARIGGLASDDITVNLDGGELVGASTDYGLLDAQQGRCLCGDDLGVRFGTIDANYGHFVKDMLTTGAYVPVRLARKAALNALSGRAYGLVALVHPVTCNSIHSGAEQALALGLDNGVAQAALTYRP